MRSYIAVTGYYGTGSSAVIDLLKEFNKVGIASRAKCEYEHIPLYSPGGLIDLYTLLSSENISVYNSDMIINNFLKNARRLNDYDYGWIGSYKKYYGNEFMDLTNDFVSEISRCTGRQSAAHIQKTKFSLLKLILQIGAKIILKRPITKLGRSYVYDAMPGYYAMPSRELLDAASKRYVTRYLEMCSEKDNDLNVFDHLLWPQQGNIIDKLFPENFKLIVLKRDPRDVYLLNKYYWHKPPVSFSKPYYPTDTKMFSKEWKETVKLDFSSDRILNLNFEDLIYKYDESINKIIEFIGVSPDSHQRKKSFFNPKMSIENTQIFLANSKWQKEVAELEEVLKDYLYTFPFERVPDKSRWFDTEAQLNKLKK